MELHLNIKVNKSGEIIGEGNLPMEIFSDFATKIAMFKGFDQMTEEAEKSVESGDKEFNVIAKQTEDGVEVTFDPPLHKDDHALFATIILSKLLEDEEE